MQAPFSIKPRPRGARKIRPSELSSEAQSNIKQGYVTSFDGAQIFYSIEGEGPPLVFCYGLVCSSLHWTYQIEYFRKRHQILWFDYRGHQNTRAPKNLRTITLETLAQDLGIILGELQIDQAVLLGHSMGVNVALEYYRQNPHAVRGLVLANGTPHSPLETLFRSNAAQAAFRCLERIHRFAPEILGHFWKAQKNNAFFRTFVSLGGFNPDLTPKADIDLYVDQVLDTDPSILLQLMHSYDKYDATAWLPCIDKPTLLLAGELDRLVPLRQQELMKQLIPGSFLEVIQRGSHCPQMDLPELVNKRIEAFLMSLEQTYQKKAV